MILWKIVRFPGNFRKFEEIENLLGKVLTKYFVSFEEVKILWEIFREILKYFGLRLEKF